LKSHEAFGWRFSQIETILYQGSEQDDLVADGFEKCRRVVLEPLPKLTL
jgi:hypothetical protein